MISLKKLFNLNTIITERITQSGMPYFAFGIFGLLNYPLSFIYWGYIDPQNYESLALRLVASFLCLGLVCKKFWPQKLTSYFPTYWYTTVLFSLPFFGTYLALQNHLSEPWIANMLLGLFLFVLLVDWVSFVTLLLIGTMLGLLMYLLSGGTLHEIPNSGWISAAYMYLFTLIIGALFSRKNHVIKQFLIREQELKGQLAEKKAAYTKMAAGSIAHDLRSPLASINAGMAGISSVLGNLITTYNVAKEAELNIPILKAKKLSALNKVIERCNNEINFSNSYINMILNNLQHDSIDTSQYKKYSIKAVLESTLDSYPYQENEKTLIHCDLAVDFEFWGSDIYLKNMLNNLLKNSFYYISAYQRGEIYICTEDTKEYFIIKLKDTAKGAPPEITEQMFDGYFSKRNGGTGLGLSFCKAVMESFGGSISVESIPEEFIEFALKFPKKR